MRLLMILTGVALLTGCTGSQPNFLSMSEEELYVYNAGKPVRQQVYCFERRETSSWIPRRRCDTVQDLIEENQRAAERLYTVSPSSGYSVFGQ